MRIYFIKSNILRWLTKAIIIILIVFLVVFYFFKFDTENLLIQNYDFDYELDEEGDSMTVHKKVDLEPFLSMSQALGNFEPKTKLSRHSPGDNGEAFNLDGQFSENRIFEKKSEYGINQLASDLIPMDRIVPDLRHNECKYWNYPMNLPAASVVIVFHNEGFSTLLRTVHSVLLHSPQHLLREVLLVDDFSYKKDLKNKLSDYIDKTFGIFKKNWKPFLQESFLGETLEEKSGKVRLIRNPERYGLIRSRSCGAREALGEVVVFLDAHCEVNVNWLVPLLTPIASNNRTLTVPIVDAIDAESLAYSSVYSMKEHFAGIWEWGMLYKEKAIDMKQHRKLHHFTEPYESPTHAGGLLAINRAFFLELGTYDNDLLIWGGENFELSFKVWLCGGRILWVPCSRVGHIYRNFAPYTYDISDSRRASNIVLSNYKRVVEVWMDSKHKNYFYTRQPQARFIEAGNLSEQLDLKEKLNCKSFSWFMENHARAVYEDFPPLPENVAWGVLSSTNNFQQCLESESLNPPSKFQLSECLATETQLLRLNEQGELGLGERCVEANSGSVFLISCKRGFVKGPWQYNKITKQMIRQEKECLTSKKYLRLAKCDPEDFGQKWYWNNEIFEK